VRQGELKKQGDVNIFFKSRWFYLKSFYLFYYKTRDDPIPQGLIILYRAPYELKKNELYIKGSTETVTALVSRGPDDSPNRNLGFV